MSPETERLLNLVDSAMLSDRHRVRQMLRGRTPETTPPADVLARAEQRLQESSRRAEERRIAHPALGNLPRLRFDDPLPICERIDEIADAIRDNPVVVVAGETGSGKSTQIPKICLKLGRGVYGMIGHTQPRRIAARSIAARLAEDLQTPLGEGVGYKVRFADAVSPRTHIKVMTDGLLLAEIQSDRFLDAYDTIIIDEAHERSLNIDLLLAHLHRLLKRRRDLRVIITSATIDAERFAAFFDSADGTIPDEADGRALRTPVIEVSGRVYPVEVRYRPTASETGEEVETGLAVADAAEELLREAPGDILVFLPTERDIREVADVLRGRFKTGPHADILPLYGRLSERDQQKIFQAHSQQRIVLATNVAESSLTVPGIRSVIDTGTARISRFAPQSKVQRLPIEPVSRASADQRKGRCGRTGPGICIRLYSEQDYLDREAYTPPEILRTNLAAAVLQTLSCGLGDLASLPLLDRPQPGAIRAGNATLLEIGAVRESPAGSRLTELGRTLGRLPVDPRIGRMIVAGYEEHCLAEILVIAAALEVRDPRDRPVDKQQAADEAHRKFAVEGSDFLTLLKIWDTYQDWADRLSNSQLKKACQQNFLSHMRMREWRDLHRQLARLIATAGMKPGPRHEDADAIHRALLTGLLSNIAVRGDANDYTGAGDQTLFLWPGSAAIAKKPKWIVAAELVETSRRFARTVGPLNPDWIEKLAKDLVKRSHSDPHWDRTAGSAMAYERVTLYGLTIVPRRRCRLGPVDPRKARELFIHHALVENDYESRAEFHRHNVALKDELKDWQAKLRQTQLFAAEEQQFQFFEERLPPDVVDSRSFELWRKEVEKEDPRRLFLSKAELLVDPTVDLNQQQYPDRLQTAGVDAVVEYRLDPTAANDGLTLVVPVEAVSRLTSARLGWLVPGLLQDKVESLIKSLPKELRRLFIPIEDTARTVVGRLSFAEGDLPTQVAAILRQLSGEHVPVDAFDSARLPGHLQFKVRAVNASGETVAAGSDLERLQTELRGEQSAAFAALAESEAKWNRDGLKDWTFGDLPEMVELAGRGGSTVAHPMLVDCGDSVSLRLTDDADVADRETRAALSRLFELSQKKRIEQQIAWLPKLETWLAQAASVMAAAEVFSGTATPQSPKALAAEFRRQLSSRIAERSCAGSETPRTEADYRRWLKRAENQISVAVQDVGELLDLLLPKAREVQKLLTGGGQPAIQQAQADVASQWCELFAGNFLSRHPWDALRHSPRYLEAIVVRWKKLVAGGLARDRELTASVGLFWNKYRQIVSQRPELRSAFETVRWLIEEYRVSLFAQQLRTPVPISDRRLREAWDAAVAKARSA